MSDTDANMTLDEFIAELEKTPRDWVLSGIGDCQIVRSSDHTLCPYNEVLKEREPLGMGLAASIWDAADRRPGHDPKLRARLLKACGLTP